MKKSIIRFVILPLLVILALSGYYLRSSLPGGTGIHTEHRGGGFEAVLAQEYNGSVGEPYTTWLFIRAMSEEQWERHRLGFEDLRWFGQGRIEVGETHLSVFNQAALVAKYDLDSRSIYLVESGFSYAPSQHYLEQVGWAPANEFKTLF